jgi:hypothetical protein
MFLRRRATAVTSPPPPPKPLKPKSYKATFIDPLTQAILFSSYELSDAEGVFLTDLSSSLALTLHSNDGLHHFSRWLFLSTYPSINSSKFTPPRSYPLVSFLERDLEYAQQYNLVPRLHYPFVSTQYPFFLEPDYSIPTYVKHNVLISPTIYKSYAMDELLEEVQWAQQKQSGSSILPSFFYQARFGTFISLVSAYIPLGYFLLRIWANLESLRILYVELLHYTEQYYRLFGNDFLDDGKKDKNSDKKIESISEFLNLTDAEYEEFLSNNSHYRSTTSATPLKSQEEIYQLKKLQSYLKLCNLIIQFNLKLNNILNDIYLCFCRNSVLVQLLDNFALDFLALYFDLHPVSPLLEGNIKTIDKNNDNPSNDKNPEKPAEQIEILLKDVMSLTLSSSKGPIPRPLESPSRNQRKISFNIRPLSSSSTGEYQPRQSISKLSISGSEKNTIFEPKNNPQSNNNNNNNNNTKNVSTNTTPSHHVQLPPKPLVHLHTPSSRQCESRDQWDGAKGGDINAGNVNDKQKNTLFLPQTNPSNVNDLNNLNEDKKSQYSPRQRKSSAIAGQFKKYQQNNNNRLDQHDYNVANETGLNLGHKDENIEKDFEFLKDFENITFEHHNVENLENLETLKNLKNLKKTQNYNRNNPYNNNYDSNFDQDEDYSDEDEDYNGEDDDYNNLPTDSPTSTPLIDNLHQIDDYEPIVNHLHDTSGDLPPPPDLREVYNLLYLALPLHPTLITTQPEKITQHLYSSQYFKSNIDISDDLLEKPSEFFQLEHLLCDSKKKTPIYPSLYEMAGIPYPNTSLGGLSTSRGNNGNVGNNFDQSQNNMTRIIDENSQNLAQRNLTQHNLSQNLSQNDPNEQNDPNDQNDPKFFNILFSLQSEVFKALIPLHQFWTLYQSHFISAVNHNKVVEYIDINDHFYGLVGELDSYLNKTLNQNNTTVAYALQIARLSSNNKNSVNLPQIPPQSLSQSQPPPFPAQNPLASSTSPKLPFPSSSRDRSNHNYHQNYHNDPSLSSSGSGRPSSPRVSSLMRTLSPRVSSSHYLNHPTSGLSSGSITELGEGKQSSGQFGQALTHRLTSSRAIEGKNGDNKGSNDVNGLTNLDYSLTNWNNGTSNNQNHHIINPKFTRPILPNSQPILFAGTPCSNNNNNNNNNNNTQFISQNNPILPYIPASKQRIGSLDVQYWCLIEQSCRYDVLNYFYIPSPFELNPITSLSFLLKQAPLVVFGSNKGSNSNSGSISRNGGGSRRNTILECDVDKFKNDPNSNNNNNNNSDNNDNNNSTIDKNNKNDPNAPIISHSSKMNLNIFASQSAPTRTNTILTTPSFDYDPELITEAQDTKLNVTSHRSFPCFALEQYKVSWESQANGLNRYDIAVGNENGLNNSQIQNSQQTNDPNVLKNRTKKLKMNLLLPTVNPKDHNDFGIFSL